jgi:hypothetical protein
MIVVDAATIVPELWIVQLSFEQTQAGTTMKVYPRFVFSDQYTFVEFSGSVKTLEKPYFLLKSLLEKSLATTILISLLDSAAQNTVVIVKLFEKAVKPAAKGEASSIRTEGTQLFSTES